MQKKVYLIVLFTITLLSGCVLNVESDKSARGAFWDEGDLGAIKRGDTSSDWILKYLGEPSKKIVAYDGNEVWQYTYRDMKETEVGFIFLFHIDVENESTRQLNVEIDDGTVKDYWTREY
jgi:hypothetical protein